MQEDMFPGYAIAKSAVEGITRTMARTFGPNNVRVNTVMPGWVPTERQLAKWWTPEGEAQTLADQALKKRITPDEFVQMVLFLGRRRRRGLHRAELPRRRWPVLIELLSGRRASRLRPRIGSPVCCSSAAPMPVAGVEAWLTAAPTSLRHALPV